MAAPGPVPAPAPARRVVEASKRLALLVLLTVAGAAPCAHANEPKVLKLVLPPRGVLEKCLTVTTTESMAYSFESAAPLAFNLHYHEGGRTHYPVPVEETASKEGVLVAESEQRYCLMWQNRGAAPADLVARYRIGPATNPEAAAEAAKAAKEP